MQTERSLAYEMNYDPVVIPFRRIGLSSHCTHLERSSTECMFVAADLRNNPEIRLRAGDASRLSPFGQCFSVKLSEILDKMRTVLSCFSASDIRVYFWYGSVRLSGSGTIPRKTNFQI